MRQYIRNYEGSVYFFTVVTHARRPWLTTELGRCCLREAFQQVRLELPFEIVAIVLLPDHLHALWKLPVGDNDYSVRWKMIKSTFTKLWRRHGGVDLPANASRRRKGERGVWQRRFYEHTCRDEADMERCITYIHVNPLKHGLVERVADWPWSSFHRYVKAGLLDPDWGANDIWYGDEFKNAE